MGFLQSKLGKGVAIAAALVAGALLSIGLALPLLVRGALEREALARGIRLEIEDVGASLSKIELHGARFEGENGFLRGTVGEIVIDAPLFGLMTDRVAAVRQARVRDVQLEVLLSARPEIEDDAAPEQGASRRRTLPPLRIDGANVRILDSRGELARASVAVVQLEGGLVRVDVDAIEVGGPSELASVRGLRAEVDAESRRLSRVDIQSVDLAGLAREEDADAFAARVRAARGETDPSGDEPDGQDTGATRYVRLLDRLSSDFELRVAHAALPHRSDREAFVLENSGFERRSASKLRIFGGGRGPSAARAAFDVEVDAIRLRANGKVDVEHLPLDAVAGLLPLIPWHEPERGVLDATLRFEATSPTVIGFQGAVQIVGLGIDSPRIATEPVVGLDFSVSAAGSWDVDARRLVLDRGTFGLGEAKVEVEGAAVLDREAWSVSMRASLPRTGCDEAVHAFPPAILGSANDFELRGTLAGQVELKADAKAPEDLELQIRVDDQCRFVEWPEHADPARFRSFFVHEALDPNREPFDFETGPRTEVWTSLEEVSPYLVAAVLAHEDASFFRHKGFSTFAIRGSLARNLAAGRFERGASTLTMQLAKNLFLNREKVLVRKLREVIYTWWLEKGFGKEATLELYLNVVEFGPFIYGVRNASLHYFGREPAELSPAEATFLATILPAPKTGAYHYERGELSRASTNRIAFLLKNMERRGFLSTEAVEYGLSELESFRFHREGEPLPSPRTLPPTDPLVETDSSSRSREPMHDDDFDPWGFP